MDFACKLPLSFVPCYFHPRRWPYNAWVFIKGSSTWNSSFLLNASRTTLSRPGVWINSTSNNAKVSCHLSCSIETLGYVSKYHKETLSMKSLVLCVPIYCHHAFRQHMTTYNPFSWIGHHRCAPQNLLLLNAIGCPYCMNTPSIAKSFTLVWISNGFVKVENLNTRANESLSFKSSNALCCCSFHST